MIVVFAPSSLLCMESKYLGEIHEQQYYLKIFFIYAFDDLIDIQNL